MKYGYCRVSTTAQRIDSQLRALRAAGVSDENLFVDSGVSGALTERPALRELLNRLQPGDEVVTLKLDRMFRGLGHAVTQMEDWLKQGVTFRALNDNIDTSDQTPAGKAMRHMLAVFAEMERDFNRERTIAGIEAARARGKRIGRPRKRNPEAAELAVMLRSRGQPISKIARTLKMSRATVYRMLGELE